MFKIAPQLITGLFVVMTSILSCSQNQNTSTAITALEEIQPLDSNVQNPDFFPVTNYIKGQIYEIKNNYITPIMITNDGVKVDTVFLKLEEVDKAVATFLDPVIDTANLKQEFKQSSFKDATLNKITFSYTPTMMHPAGSPLKSWNVYIDPQTNQVSSIYLLKITPGKGTEHLNWIAGKKCTIQLMKDDVLVYERSITWNFDNND